jgi:hypothetical protein
MITSCPWQLQIFRPKAAWQQLPDTSIYYTAAPVICFAFFQGLWVIGRHEQNWHVRFAELADNLAAHPTRGDRRFDVAGDFDKDYR